MVSAEMEEPVTPVGRLFARPEINQIINCVIGSKNPIDIEAVKAEISNSVLLKQPRFNSLLVVDSRGHEHWRRTQLNFDKHIIIRHEPLNEDSSVSEEDAVNDYLADLSVSSPLSTDKPLWEFHFLVPHNCAVLRVHHALGDGISLLSMFLTSCRKADDPSQLATIGGVELSKTKSSSSNQRWRNLWWLLKGVWYTLVFVLEFIMRIMWLKDKKTALSGGAGVELWPRKLATAKFSLEDMKAVKKAVTNATINDVLIGLISCGLSRYLDMQSPKEIKEGVQITGVSMVNLRMLNGPQDFAKMSDNEKGTRYGNQFGVVLIPVYYHQSVDDPLQYVKRAKSMIDKKKQSAEAPFSHKIVALAMTFGSKVAGMLNYRVLCNTTFTMSNIIGPLEEITIRDNPVTYMRVNSTSLPHALTMHMLSYAGRADMQILVAKDIIPDPKVLAKCFEDSLLDMKKAAAVAADDDDETNGDCIPVA